MTNTEIRAATKHDRDAIFDIAVDSGLFEPEHLGELTDSVDAYFAAPQPGEQWLLAAGANPGQVLGAAYVAPERMTQGTYNLYFIAVRRALQGRGVGTQLLRRVEEVCRESGARLLLVETSGLDGFEMTRRFYRLHHYDEEARIRDYYAEGDDKVTFRKAVR